MHIHGKRMADYNTGFVAPRLPKRGVLHPSKRGSYLSEAKRRRKRSRYSLLSTFLLFILSSRLTIFTFALPSLSLSFVIVRVPTDGIWSTCEPLERVPRHEANELFRFFPWNGFYGWRWVTVSWDPRVSYEIWQRDNRVIIRIKAMRDWGWFRERSVALVSIRFLFITFSRLFNFNFP